MHIGIGLVAPEGLGSLYKGQTYHLLGNRSDLPRVTLAFFSKVGPEWRADIIRLPRREFEEALLGNAIVPLNTQPTLPPWLRTLEGRSLDSLEDGRVSKSKSYRARAEARYELIHGLLTKSQEIEASEQPAKRAAKILGKTGTEVRRAFLWYCAYLCFGRSLLALVPSYRNAGYWDRTRKGTRKLGRPAMKGRRAGHSAVLLADAIANAWIKRAQPGIPLTAIYRNALRLDFGCKIRQGKDRIKEFYHPENQAFPTYTQFRYWINKWFGAETVKRSTIGDSRYRTDYAENHGRFSESVANMYEVCEADGYYLKERPRSILSDAAGPRLSVVRIVDVTSSQIIGIGFAEGTENSDAYRAAKFCAAIDKRYFAYALFGIDIDNEDWPGQGLPLSVINDRGPGSSERVEISSEDAPVISNLAPSYSGQSKSTVESSHPRDIAVEGAPTHVISDLNAFGLARREVMQVLKDNEGSDVTSRLTPEMIRESVRPTPNGMADFLLKRGRTSAMPKSVEAAVREYLKPISFTLDYQGLRYGSMSYDARNLQKLGVLPKMRRNQSTNIAGYVYPLSLRTVWIEASDTVHGVEAILAIRDDTDQLYMSLSELSELGEKRREMGRRMPEHRSAAIADQEQKHFDITGIEWNAGSQHSGKPPSSHSRSRAVKS